MLRPARLVAAATQVVGIARRCRLVGPRAWMLLVLLALAPAPLRAAEPAVTAALESSMPPTGAALPVPSPLWALPFATLLALIATLPLVGPAQHWWEHNRNKLLAGLALGLIVLVHYGTRPFGFSAHGHPVPPGWASVRAVLEHAILDDYVPFITLLFSLYVVAGGLQVKGDLRALPAVNTGILGLGALLASVIGTTGASMVLIRPLLQTNRDRQHVRHTVIFFIFLVSNVGGLLLPLGDPPLFLGYLQGVPFGWTLSLIGPWLVTVVSLLLIYYLWDRLFAFPREAADILAIEERHLSPVRLHGQVNLLYLLGIVLAVALVVPGVPLPGTSWVAPPYLRELILLGLAGLSLASTPRGLRAEVQFHYGAILEVAALFLGIFLTMQVPMEILRGQGTALPLRTPLHFFWATGVLSSVLDNAPTYLVFFETARALGAAGGSAAGPLLSLADGSTIPEPLLRAIALGAVFMGANTYIGNGPNFMVKAIAESHGVRMPSFVGYLRYSVGVLVPVLALVGWLFCR